MFCVKFIGFTMIYTFFLFFFMFVNTFSCCEIQIKKKIQLDLLIENRNHLQDNNTSLVVLSHKSFRPTYHGEWSHIPLKFTEIRPTCLWWYLISIIMCVLSSVTRKPGLNDVLISLLWRYKFDSDAATVTGKYTNQIAIHLSECDYSRIPIPRWLNTMVLYCYAGCSVILTQWKSIRVSSQYLCKYYKLLDIIYDMRLYGKLSLESSRIGFVIAFVV